MARGDQVRMGGDTRDSVNGPTGASSASLGTSLQYYGVVYEFITLLLDLTLQGCRVAEILQDLDEHLHEDLHEEAYSKRTHKVALNPVAPRPTAPPVLSTAASASPCPACVRRVPVSSHGLAWTCS